jgi:hypothetical protein
MRDGYGHPVFLNATQKAYFILRNEDKSMIKIITAISKERMGEVVLRAIPVKD